MLPSIMKYTPAVCAVGKNYQILIPARMSAILWVRVGETDYYDESNGILRSDTDLHRVTVPMSELDAAGAYTVCWREVAERKPYFPVVGDVQSVSFSFRPLRSDPIHAYMLADTHGAFESPVGAAKAFAERYGGIDLLILNGDILEHSGDAGKFILYYQIAEALTGGEIPVVISRGNHDLRGKYAEKLSDYMPNENGNSFYTFRLGNLWGILLDCGEDKNDDCPEYGGTICCHAFRARETAFLQQVIDRADTEFAEAGVAHRIAISHVPFTQIERAPFDIEQDTYRRWVQLLNDRIQPEFLLSGHIHRSYITRPGDARDAYGMRFPTVVGSEVCSEDHSFTGCGILWEKGAVRIIFNEQETVTGDTVL